MKKIKFILTIAIIVSLLSSCKEEVKLIKVGYLPIAECLPLYVAKEKGFFEKYGLTVELVSESGGPNIFKDLDAEAIDIGFSNVVTLVKQSNAGKSYKSIFGATYETINNTNHAIFGRNSDSIDYKKAIFGINARNNIEELMLLNYLKSKGIKITNELLTNFREVPFPQMLPALKDKTIDYSCNVEPFITIAKSDTSIYKYVNNHYQVTDKSKALVATYVSTAKTIKDKQNVVDKFIKAMNEATDYINTGNNDSKKFILIYTKTKEELLNKISFSEFTTKIEEAELTKIIDLMYNSEINFTKSFIPNPDKKINASDLIYQNGQK